MNAASMSIGDWTAEAACKGHDTDLWYPTRGDDSPRAKVICLRCPVQAECLDHALRHETNGIWAATSEKERRKIRRARRIRLVEYIVPDLAAPRQPIDDDTDPYQDDQESA